MPDLQNLLDQIDRLDQQATKGPWEVVDEEYDDQIIANVTRSGLLETTERIVHADDAAPADREFIALARTTLPQLAKALRAVIESCEETIRSVDKNLLPDERDHANRDHADMVLDAITDAIGADHA